MQQTILASASPESPFQLPQLSPWDPVVMVRTYQGSMSSGVDAKARLGELHLTHRSKGQYQIVKWSELP